MSGNTDKEMARTIVDPDESTVLDGDDGDDDDDGVGGLLATTTAGGGGGSELERRKKSSSTPGKHRQQRGRRLRGGNDEAPGENQASATPPAEPAQEQDPKIAAADGVSVAPTAAPGGGGVGEPILAAASMATKANADRDGGSEEDLESTVDVSTILDCGAKGATTGDPKVDQLFRATLASLRSAITGLKDKNDACESQIKLFAMDFIKFMRRDYYFVDGRLRQTEDEMCKMRRELAARNDQLSESRRESMQLREKLAEAESSRSHHQLGGGGAGHGQASGRPLVGDAKSVHDSKSIQHGGELANVSVEEHKKLLQDKEKLEKTIDCLEEELYELRRENIRLTRERAEYENAIQRALLKGVSSLNAEALKVLKCTPKGMDEPNDGPCNKQPQQLGPPRHNKPSHGGGGVSAPAGGCGGGGGGGGGRGRSSSRKKYPDCGITQDGFIKALCDTASEASDIGGGGGGCGGCGGGGGASRPSRHHQRSSMPCKSKDQQQQQRNKPVIMLNERDAADCGMIKANKGCNDNNNMNRGGGGGRRRQDEDCASSKSDLADVFPDVYNCKPSSKKKSSSRQNQQRPSTKNC